MADVWIKRGDLLPRITAQLVDAQGEPVSLAGASGVRFRMRALRGTELVIDADAEIDDEATGLVGYTPQGTDTAVAGGFIGEFSATFAGKRETFPNDAYVKVAILEDLRAPEVVP